MLFCDQYLWYIFSCYDDIVNQKILGLTAIEAWVIVSVLFVFGALAEYAGVLLKIKIAATRSSTYYPGRRGLESPIANSIVLANGNTILQDEYNIKFEVI